MFLFITQFFALLLKRVPANVLILIVFVDPSASTDRLRDPDPEPDEDTQIYANLSRPRAVATTLCRSMSDRLEDASVASYHENSSIYSNITSSSNPQLVAKTEALMQELEEQAPNLSRELKLKIVHAILEEEPNTVAELQRDSDEGRNIPTISEFYISYK